MLPLYISDVPLHCINQAAQTYHIPAKLIIAVLNVEQGKIGTAHKNKNGSVDLGDMQINSSWKPILTQHNITLHDVQYNPCVNVSTAAWILAKSITEGNNLLEGVGNYNSHTPSYNHAYTQKVREKYTVLQFITAKAKP